MVIQINADSITKEQIESLRGILVGHHGECVTVLHMEIPEHSQVVIALGDTFRVAPTDELVAQVEKLLGEATASFV